MDSYLNVNVFNNEVIIACYCLLVTFPMLIIARFLFQDDHRRALGDNVERFRSSFISVGGVVSLYKRQLQQVKFKKKY